MSKMWDHELPESMQLLVRESFQLSLPNKNDKSGSILDTTVTMIPDKYNPYKLDSSSGRIKRLHDCRGMCLLPTSVQISVAILLSSKQRPTEIHHSCCLSTIPFLQLSIAAQECRTFSDIAI